jgi:glycerophosphoryl diester phosphodiesterase
MHIQSPENTLASLVHGMQMFDGIEFDIRLTSDDQIVIHHDRTISVDPGSAIRAFTLC